jgi:SAM-dependent methyltransferase
MGSRRLDTRQYWDQRLASDLSLRGTGHRAFDLSYNFWLYQAQLDRCESVMQRNGIQLVGKHALDVGSGSGFWIEYLLQKGTASVYGIDISETSIQYLEKRYPKCHFFVQDISDSTVDYLFEQRFNFISALGILYHIVDETCFQQALHNLCRLLVPGGYLLLSDTFRKTFLPAPQHVRFRPLMIYQSIFQQHDTRVLQIAPLYYLLNRSFIPFIGPKILSLLRVGRMLYWIDDSLWRFGLVNGTGIKLLLARRNT